MPETWNPDATLPLGESVAPAPSNVLVGRYRVGVLLGRGGSGQVHEAFDERTDRTVAIKFVTARTGWTQRQLQRELTALRLLHLPGVVELLDTGIDQGQVFLVMPLLSRGTFADLSQRGGWSTWHGEAIAALQALARIHCAGVVHRDIKPSNLLLDADEQPVITDFGLAMGKSVADDERGRAEGTPRYMAPEQRAGAAPHPTVDVYSFGMMLAEMLDDAEAPPLVRQVVRTMCDPNPARRPADAVAVLDALGRQGQTLVLGRATSLPDPPTEADVRALFAPRSADFLHIEEDASSLLFRRSKGRRSEVIAQVSQWVRTGRAHWANDGLVLRRPDLDALLEQDDEQTAVVLDALRTDAPDTVERVMAQCRASHAVGRTDRAMALVQAIVGADEDDAALAMMEYALTLQQRQHLDQATYFAQRYEWPQGLALLQAATTSLHASAERGLLELKALGVLPDPTLEGWRLGLAIHAALRVDRSQVDGLLAMAEAWAGDEPLRRGRLDSWRARVAYTASDFAGALDAEQRALSRASTPFQRLARLTNAASAAMEVPNLAIAEDLSSRALALARTLRHAAGEVRATWLVRSVSHRQERDPSPQPALVHAAAQVSPALAGQLAITEGARAYRTGDLDLARDLARQGAAHFEALSARAGASIARALAVASGDVVGPDPASLHGLPKVLLAEIAALCALGGRPLGIDVDPTPFLGRLHIVLHGDEMVAALAGNTA
ncbi:MAG: protein kinase [Myxococcota bacterium]